MISRICLFHMGALVVIEARANAEANSRVMAYLSRSQRNFTLWEEGVDGAAQHWLDTPMLPDAAQVDGAAIHLFVNSKPLAVLHWQPDLGRYAFASAEPVVTEPAAAPEGETA